MPEQTPLARRTEAVVISILVAIVTASSAPWWWPPLSREIRHLRGQDIAGLSGGCGGYQLYAQNRWDPVGAAVRAAPDPGARKVGGYAPNEIVNVDGWVHTKVAYPNNAPPYDSDIWFHLSDDSGWVSFAGVRGAPSFHDSTLRSTDGGIPAATPEDCDGSVT